jgi:hypothetical protein
MIRSAFTWLLPALAAVCAGTPAFAAGEPPHECLGSASGTCFAIHGNWTARSPGINGEIETGRNTGAGLLNGTFVVEFSEDEPQSKNGSYILHHLDIITSATHTHLDATGARVPDTIHDDLTITAIPDNGQFRFTFIGRLFDGTGIFDGAEGYYTGDGSTILPRDAEPNVGYVAGTIAGELRLP